MRIVFLSDVYFPYVSGVVVSIANASKELIKRGHEVYLLTGQSLPNQIPNGLKIISLKSSQGISKYPEFHPVSLSSFMDCRRALEEIQPDILHTHTPTILALFGNYFSWKLGIPLISTYHTFLPDTIHQIAVLDRLNKKLALKLVQIFTCLHYNKAQAVITPSQVIKDAVHHMGIERPIHVISNGIRTKLFQGNRFSENNTVRFLHVGRLSEEKNIDVLLKAFQLVLQNTPKTQLDIVGSGPAESHLRHLATSLGIAHQIRFLGKIPHEELPGYYLQSDVFVTASTFETEGLVILEAMASGLPIIGVNQLAIPSLVLHEHNGLVAKPFDIEEIAHHMSTLAQNQTQRIRMGHASRERAQKYDLRYSIDLLEQLYNTTIRGYGQAFAKDKQACANY